MKRSFALVTVLLFMPSASADVYVKVDANGNAIGGAIMCDAATCAADSQYSQLTLQPGERYQLQGVGVSHGIGNNNPGVEVKHEATTNEWVVTREAAPVERFTTYAPSAPAPSVEPVHLETTTVITETQTATIDTSTVLNDTATVTSVDTFDWDAFWLKFETLFRTWLQIWGKL